MKSITLYTTHCPKCTILQKKLEAKNIQFDVVQDVQVMKEKKIMSVPVLQVDGQMFDYYNAVKFVNSYQG